MNNWNELDSYARGKVETRQQEAEEWRLARLARNQTQAEAKESGSRFALPRILIGLVARWRVVWLGA